MRLGPPALLVLVVLLVLARPPATDAQGQWEAPPEAKGRRNPLPASAEVIAQGRSLYQVRGCSHCHGPEGDGSGAPAFDPKPAELRSAVVQSQTDGELFWKIYSGRGQMPPQFILAEQELWALVHFLRTLKK
jgi:mono/diheme cytochrome c family protein